MQYIDMQKQMINTLKVMMKIKNLHFFNISMRATCMVGQCQNQYLLMVLNGWKICLK